MKTRKERDRLRSQPRTGNVFRARPLVFILHVLAALSIGFVLLVLLVPHSVDLLNLTFQQIVGIDQDDAATYRLPKERSSPATGPLRVNPANTRYLTDADESGEAIILVGSNYWNLLQDGGRTNPPPAFDFDAFVGFAVNHGYNYLKWHTWEHAWHQSDGRDWYIQPTIYARTGPGLALDGDPKFDLNTFNPDFFNRLRSRVIYAGQNGLYVAVDIFQGFSIADGNTMSNQWLGHPFNANNNINGIDGDPIGQGHGRDTETLILPAITAYQEAYVEHMIDTLNDLDNVIWEVALEPDGTYSRDGYDAFDWLDHFISYIHAYEATKPKQHPVLYSSFYPGGDNDALFASKAEIVAPNGDGGFDRDTPPLDGTKVVHVDTDHILWTETNGADWAWRAFTRGAGGFAIMDGGYSDYDDQGGGANYADAENFRYTLGWILDYANRLNLVEMTPRRDLCSTGYCLANPVAVNAEYLVYLPAGRMTSAILEILGTSRQEHERTGSIYLPLDSTVTVDLSSTPGNLMVEWFNPGTGEITAGEPVTGGTSHDFIAPFTGSAVLYLYQSH